MREAGLVALGALTPFLTPLASGRSKGSGGREAVRQRVQALLAGMLEQDLQVMSNMVATES